LREAGRGVATAPISSLDLPHQVASPTVIHFQLTKRLHLTHKRIHHQLSTECAFWPQISDNVRVTRTLNIAAAPQAVFMRVAALPWPVKFPMQVGSD
jgi:hypothetical protein